MEYFTRVNKNLYSYKFVNVIFTLATATGKALKVRLSQKLITYKRINGLVLRKHNEVWSVFADYLTIPIFFLFWDTCTGSRGAVTNISVLTITLILMLIIPRRDARR